MSDAVDPHLTEPYGLRTRSCATELVCRDCGYRTPLLDKAFKCPACGEGLDVDYDYELAKKRIAERSTGGAALEHLALRGAAADPQPARPKSGSPSSPAKRR